MDTPVPEPVTDPTQDLVAQVDYLERVLAALVAKVGPVQICGSEYTAARPIDLRPMHTGDPATAPDADAPIVWALPEHLTVTGLVTSEHRVATVLRSCSDADADEQARAVLRELGLPVRGGTD